MTIGISDDIHDLSEMRFLMVETLYLRLFATTKSDKGRGEIFSL